MEGIQNKNSTQIHSVGWVQSGVFSPMVFSGQPILVRLKDHRIYIPTMMSSALPPKYFELDNCPKEAPKSRKWWSAVDYEDRSLSCRMLGSALIGEGVHVEAAQDVERSSPWPGYLMLRYPRTADDLLKWWEESFAAVETLEVSYK